MNMKTRFAPSPTGLLHVGNIRTALVNWLLTKHSDGKFLLRIDDTDLERCKDEYVEQIKQDLTWLGLEWDEYFHQKDRFKEYEKTIDLLKEKGFLYPCYETKDELDTKRKMLLSRGLPPIYDRESLKLSKEQISEYEKQGKKPHYRFKLKDEIIKWDDLVRGEITFDGKNLSDPIVIREDGTLTYMLCTVIDDIYAGITHIVRGEDHITNTAMHIQFFEALGATPPTFAHLALIQGKDAKISKRIGGMDILSLRKQGIIKEAIASFLSRLGHAEPIIAFSSLKEIIDNFDIDKYSKSKVQYDINDLIIINHKVLQKMSYSQVKSDLEYLGININEEFWESVKTNIDTLLDLKEWHDICEGNIEKREFSEDDKKFLKQSIECLPEEKWDHNTWDKWISKLKSVSDRKGKSMFLPIRLALTGKEQGPELKFLLPIMGKDTVIKRLSNPENK